MSGGIAFVLLQMGATGCPTPGFVLLKLRRLESSRRGDAGEDCRKAGCRQAMGSRCPNDPCHRNRPAGPQVLKSPPGTATRNNGAIALRGCVANARFRTAIPAKLVPVKTGSGNPVPSFALWRISAEHWRFEIVSYQGMAPCPFDQHPG